MSDTLSFAELEAQDVQLLPARIVLSLLSTGPGVGINGPNGSHHNGLGFGSGTNFHFGGTQTNMAGKGIGGAGGLGIG